MNQGLSGSSYKVGANSLGITHKFLKRLVSSL